MSTQVYLNGQFVPYEKALVHVEDRGYVYADGVYEVIRLYAGQPFELEAHLERLERSSAGIRLNIPAKDELTAAAWETIRRNNIDEGTLYIQVTRGVAPRRHQFPEQVAPVIYMLARTITPPSAALMHEGVSVITVPDIRWHHCNIKAIALLANVLAKQQAADANAYEAIFVRPGVGAAGGEGTADGTVTEGSSTNVFAVVDGQLYTHPEGPYILSGITRQVVLRLAAQERITLREEPVLVSQLAKVTEIFITSTTNEVMPVTKLDGCPVGNGRPGPITLQLAAAFTANRGAS